MNKRQTLILLWFCGATAVLFVINYIYLFMAIKGIREIAIYEFDNIIFYIEAIIISFLSIFSLWILINYIIKLKHLDLIKK